MCGSTQKRGKIRMIKFPVKRQSLTSFLCFTFFEGREEEKKAEKKRRRQRRREEGRDRAREGRKMSWLFPLPAFGLLGLRSDSYSM